MSKVVSKAGKIFGRPDIKKPKVAIYLRRSRGEGGKTIDQLESVMQTIEGWEKEGIIRKVDRGVVGRDPKKERRGLVLKAKGDIYNEGEAESGYKVAERPVFMNLVQRLRKGQYQGVIAIDMERFARDYGALSAYAYDTWREQNPPVFYHGIIDKLTLGTTGPDAAIDEAIINSKMTWGGVSKRGEIRKGERKRKTTNVDRGYYLGARPEWLGKQYRGKTQTKVVDYRAAYDAKKAGKSTSEIAIAAGKYDKRGKPERGFVRNWMPRLQGYEDMGALERWLDAVEAVNDFIRSLSPTQPKSGFRNAANILANTAGYFAYPQGVLIVDDTTGERELVRFPYPLDFDLAELNADKDPTGIPGWSVERMEIPEDYPLHYYQQQHR